MNNSERLFCILLTFSVILEPNKYYRQNAKLGGCMGSAYRERY